MMQLGTHKIIELHRLLFKLHGSNLSRSNSVVTDVGVENRMWNVENISINSC